MHPPDIHRDNLSKALENGRSSNRLRYEAEVNLIRTKYGDLEQIRSRLGLSRRKICQLLMVDPSAWTRWNQSGGHAPPHIYRALEWYILLAEKEPRALLPMGTWSSTAFEDRLVGLESGLQQVSKARAGLMGAMLLVGAIGGALLILIFH
jgi:hypothetical protein